MPKRLPKHDPGGLVRIPLPDHVLGTAVFGGKSDEYRYRLSREWGTGKRVLFVMMNPSTADPLVDDPSVAKCRRFSVKWGYGKMYVGNTFAYRATDQARLALVKDPVGPENDTHLLAMAKDSSLIVFAYGKPKHRALRERGPAVARLLRDHGCNLHVLRLSIDGTPWHPLYLRETLTPVEWSQQAHSPISSRSASSLCDLR
ncbi:MAG: DUF1643 domain-containing protein [Acidobacteriota bacterium]